MSKPGAQRYKDIELNIVGSTKFGRYNKMSSEQTFNMIISDNWMVNFAGYKMRQSLSPLGRGRGIYSSANLKTLFAVIDDVIWAFDSTLSRTYIHRIDSFIKDVYIAENNNGEVVFSDQKNLYVWQPSSSTFTTLTPTDLGFTPGYISFQNGRIISPDITSSLWRLSDINNAISWPDDSQHEGALQTKPDKAVATIRVPGRGNLLLVFGSTVSEPWNDVGATLFPYQRNQSINIDYGCMNPSTIAQSENIVCWLAANEKSGPTIIYSNGGDIKKISNDGIDFRLSQLKHPTNSYGFIFKQDGHLFYVVTFILDNITYAYDFNTESFFTLTDENLNAFIVKKVAFFNGQYYFISIKDGNLYQLGTQFVGYDYGNDNIYDIPRIRITKSIALPDQSRFVAGYSGFTIQQGQYDFEDRNTEFNLITQNGSDITTENGFLIGGGQNYRNHVPRVDMAISNDGGVNFGSFDGIELNSLGRRANKLMWHRLGASNDMTHMFRFTGMGNFTANSGITGIYQ